MEKTRKIRCFTTFIILIILIIILLIMNVCIGTVHISFKAAFATLYDHSDRVGRIVWDIRMPRAIAAMILGGALALAGYLLQTFFHNPIAGPFVLGSMSMLVVSGVMIGYICSAVTEFVVTFADDSDIVNLHNWSRGSFSGMTWDSVGVMSIVVGITFVFVFLMSKPLMAYQLGESYAVNLGVNIKRIRVLLVLLSSLLSACIVAFAGPISFVGIAVPHIVKSMLKSTKPIYMIPACFLGGAVFCLFCDLLARMMFAPTELSISTVTAVFGAPVVLFIMIRRSKEKNV